MSADGGASGGERGAETDHAGEGVGPHEEAAPAAPPAPATPDSVRGSDLLEEVRAHLATYVNAPDDDLDLLTLWAAHTHLVEATYTTPRLLLDSPLPGSGKTTVLEHLERLTVNAVSMASVSSDAMLPRLIDSVGVATILIDEADRSLRPDKPGAQDLIAIINSGYKLGATRPTLVPTKGGGWEVKQLPTFSPVAMAGNDPILAEDTLSRTLRVLLLPDVHGDVDETAWEVIDADTRAIGGKLARWASAVRAAVTEDRATLPHGVRGRRGECWRPLKRVAVAAGGRWPSVADDLAQKDQEELSVAREEGVARTTPHVRLLQHLREVWPEDEAGNPAAFVATATLISRLVQDYPDHWGRQSSFGSDLTPQRLARMLTKAYKIQSTRPGGHGQRGYAFGSFARAWRAMKVSDPEPLASPGASGASGAPGPTCTACRRPMAWAAAVGGFTTHPTCEETP